MNNFAKTSRHLRIPAAIMLLVRLLRVWQPRGTDRQWIGRKMDRSLLSYSLARLSLRLSGLLGVEYFANYLFDMPDSFTPYSQPKTSLNGCLVDRSYSECDMRHVVAGWPSGLWLASWGNLCHGCVPKMVQRTVIYPLNQLNPSAEHFLFATWA